MPDHRPIPAADGLAGAVARGLEAKRSWARDGFLVSPASFAAQRGVATEDLELLEAGGELFSLSIDSQRWYPAEVLKLPADASAAICRSLAGVDPATQFVFVVRKHGALDGQTVAEAVAHGLQERVLKLAGAWRAEFDEETRRRRTLPAIVQDGARPAGCLHVSVP